jgi:hypothetical protein
MEGLIQVLESGYPSEGRRGMQPEWHKRGLEGTGNTVLLKLGTKVTAFQY